MRPDRFSRLEEVLARRQPDLTVLMERVNKTHNFSAILRNCDAVGVLEAHVIPHEPGFTVHATASAGASKWVRVRRHEDLRDALRALRRDGFRLVAAEPGPGAVDYRSADFTRPTAFLVGAELHGLSDEALRAADDVVTIPMEGMVRSLNVSVATALLLYEARRQREAAGLYRDLRLSPERYREVLFEWAYPRLAGICRRKGIPYPELDDRGELVDPPRGAS